MGSHTSQGVFSVFALLVQEVLSSTTLTQPCPRTTPVWDSWSRWGLGGAELLCGQGWRALAPQTQPSAWALAFNPVPTHWTRLALLVFSHAISMQSSHQEQSPCAVLQNAVVSLQCSRRRLEGTSSTPSTAGTSTAPRPCAFLADALPKPWLAIPVLRIRCFPGWSLPAVNRPGSESFLVFNWLGFQDGPSLLPSPQQANDALLPVEIICVFKDSFPCSFRNILARLIRMDFVGLKCFVFLQLLYVNSALLKSTAFFLLYQERATVLNVSCVGTVSELQFKNSWCFSLNLLVKSAIIEVLKVSAHCVL